MPILRVGLIVLLAMMLDLPKTVDGFEEAVHRPLVRVISRLAGRGDAAHKIHEYPRLGLIRKPLSGHTTRPSVRKLPPRVTDTPLYPEN